MTALARDDNGPYGRRPNALGPREEARVPPRQPRTPNQRPDPQETEARRPGPIVVITMGLAMYFVVLWFGVSVIGDNAGRSAVMSAVILALFGGWYLTTRKPRVK